MLYYFLITFILLVVILVYFKIAIYFKIIDEPNNRSSHTIVTIRGGGIIFPISVLIWYVINGFNQPWIIIALLLMSIISFLDDLVTLSSWVRILFHFTAVSLLFTQIQILDLSWYMIITVYIFTIGWINAFNFMDGINGITGIYSLVSLTTFAWINRTIGFISEQLLIFLILSVFVFLFFNARKRAKVFAGDVGSVSMAFLLAWFLISLIKLTGRFEYILFFTIYGIDSTITIVYRLIRRENIFNAHRTHLFQYLSNELNMSHIGVSVIYGVLQSGINVLTFELIANGKMTWSIFLWLLFLLSFIYIIIRYFVLKSIQIKSINAK
jgi:UDP-N-acetylmuramyl pentapeptide phosphotransferase/UDP-N-acetylglucosamine-1-phosphate transferase